MTDVLVVISNVALVVVTAAAVWATLHEDHRHEEAVIREVATDTAKGAHKHEAARKAPTVPAVRVMNKGAEST